MRLTHALFMLLEVQTSNSELATLPVLTWSIDHPVHDNQEAEIPCSLEFNGKRYENVQVEIHGQTTRRLPKYGFNFKMSSGQEFVYDENEKPIRRFSLLTTYTDKTQMRQILAYETFAQAGVPSHKIFPVRVEQNGKFLGVYHFCDDGDETYLERNYLPKTGALYKMNNGMQSADGGEFGWKNRKKTRKKESFADLAALISNLQTNAPARLSYFYDNVNVPEVINFLAALTIAADRDCCDKNYYLYRDTEGTGEWSMFPWDLDLTFGRNFSSDVYYYSDKVFPTNPIFLEDNCLLSEIVFGDPVLKTMYLRRLRSLMDEFLQPPGTPKDQLRFEKRIFEIQSLIARDVKEDQERWPTWGKKQTLAQAVETMINQFFMPRREFLYSHPDIPKAQATNAIVKIAEVNLKEGAFSFVKISNPNGGAIDVSGWKLTEGVIFTFPPGSVVPSNGSVYVSPDVKAFRNRTNSPKGGQSNLVVGPLHTESAGRSRLIILKNGDRRVDTAAIVAN